MLGPLEYMFGASLRLALLLAAGLGVVFLLLARRDRLSAGRAIADWLLASSVTAVVAFTQWSPYDNRGRFVDLRPLHAISSALPGRGASLMAANIALFVPVGVAFACQRWSPRRAVLSAAALSIAAEVTQYVTATGRFAQVDDVIMNTCGAVLGVALVCVLARSPRSGSVQQGGVAGEVERRAGDEPDPDRYGQRHR